MKHGVICYSHHRKKVLDVRLFDTYNDALEYMRADARLVRDIASEIETDAPKPCMSMAPYKAIVTAGEKEWVWNVFQREE